MCHNVLKSDGKSQKKFICFGAHHLHSCCRAWKHMAYIFLSRIWDFYVCRKMHNSAFCKVAAQGLLKGANVVSFLSPVSRQNAAYGKDDGQKLTWKCFLLFRYVGAWFGNNPTPISNEFLNDMLIVWLTKSTFVRHLKSKNILHFLNHSTWTQHSPWHVHILWPGPIDFMVLQLSDNMKKNA